VLGGVLTAWLNWRSVMLVNVPIGAGLLIAGLAALQPSGLAGLRRPRTSPGAERTPASPSPAHHSDPDEAPDLSANAPARHGPRSAARLTGHPDPDGGHGLRPASGRIGHSNPDGGGPRIDVPGALAVTLAAAAIVYGVATAPERGWGSAPVLGALVGGLVLLALFLVIECRSESPLIPRDVVATRNVAMGNILTLCMGVVLTAPLFFLSLYLQQVLGNSSQRTGLALLPMSLVISAGVLLSRRLILKVSARVLLATGGLLAAAGLLWLGHLPAHSSYLTHVLLPTLIVGAGTSVTMMPAIVAATSGIAPNNAGVASGLLNMCRQLGAALGLAALVTVAASVTHHDHAAGPAAVVHGYNTAFLILAAISTVTAALALLLRSTPPNQTPEASKPGKVPAPA
jgi:hypothetical protein